MTAIDTSTAAVTALMDGVTEGPWASEANGVYAFDGMRLVASLKEHIGGRDWPTTERDRNFIAAARQLVPALVAERDAADQRAGALLARVAALDADCMAARQAAAENYARAEKAEARVAKLSDALAEIATAKVDALRQPPHSARNPPWEDADPVVDAEEAWALQQTARDALKEMENGQ